MGVLECDCGAIFGVWSQCKQIAERNHKFFLFFACYLFLGDFIQGCCVHVCDSMSIGITILGDFIIIICDNCFLSRKERQHFI